MCARRKKRMTDRPARIPRTRCSISRYALALRSVLSAEIGSSEREVRKDTVPTRGSRAGPTTHPHSRIKHKCHLPMPDPHEPRASPFLLLLLLSETARVFFPAARSFFSHFETPVVAHSLIPALVAGFVTRRYFPPRIHVSSITDRRKRRDLMTIYRAET